ncbi:MAG: S8 family serine peptidase [Bacteroidales bacterium]|jgi:subtilisin family serine protease|nr:S8 family serine peptidase [Bacteroidales bacterium]
MKFIVFYISISLSMMGFSQKPSLEHLAKHQTARMGADYFAQQNLTGKGIRIAVFDAGFPDVNIHPAFEHIRKNIVATYDFTKNSENIYRGHWHGTAVLSNIAGKMGDIPLGLAPDAEFLLAITEVTKGEKGWEEETWRRAVEWAAEHGAQIISSSLGYGKDRYFQEDMDGQTSAVAKAAQIAAEKGILVINAAGNEGSNTWKQLITPADAGTVLSVGGIDPTTQLHSGFSSFGPSADGRLKPNVCANSTTVAAMPKGKYKIVDGTSFATPLVSGFAACVWQANPDLKAADIFKFIEMSGELFPHYDYAHGYGVPNAWYFDTNRPEPSKTFDFIETNDIITVQISDELLPQLGKSNLYRLYYHLQKTDGLLSEYAVIDVFQKNAWVFPKDKLEGIKQISVHFLGYTQTYEIR